MIWFQYSMKNDIFVHGYDSFWCSHFCNIYIFIRAAFGFSNINHVFVSETERNKCRRFDICWWNLCIDVPWAMNKFALCLFLSQTINKTSDVCQHCQPVIFDGVFWIELLKYHMTAHFDLALLTSLHSSSHLIWMKHAFKTALWFRLNVKEPLVRSVNTLTSS